MNVKWNKENDVIDLYAVAAFFSFDLLLLAHIDSNFMQNNCNWNWKK